LFNLNSKRSLEKIRRGYMPTWLKCTNCGEKFYTAKSYQFIADKVCEKCGSELKPNSKTYKQKRKIQK